MGIFTNFFVQNYCTFKYLQYLCTERNIMEVKESIEGKRKMNTLDNLINELANEATKAAVEEAWSGKNPNKVYDNVEDLFNDLDSEISKNNV